VELPRERNGNLNPQESLLISQSGIGDDDNRVRQNEALDGKDFPKDGIQALF
jgi:hypothetical protein